MSERKVLDHGFVRLEDYMADDLSVVNSARVSLHKRSELEHSGDGPGSFYYLKDDDEKLINFLMKNRHGTPFEHNAFRFHIKVPIFVVREWQRHRIASYNEWSGRYAVLEPSFYIPDYVRTQVGKPGAYTFEPLDEENAASFRRRLTIASNDAYEQYEKAMQLGNVAKEQARLFLPLNIYTEMYWTINARSMMNFLSLRNADQAQWEIAQYAIAVEAFFKEHMPVTHDAFVVNGRRAP